MKIKLFHIIPTLLVVMTLGGCKTTEENYRRAYEAAVAKQNEAFTADEIASINHEEAIPKSVYKGDSIPLKGVYVSTVKVDPPVTAALRYNLIVATFKQKFNAMSVLERLRASGYDDVRLLIDRDQLYYVDAVSTDSLDKAVEALRKIRKNPPLQMRSPCPYILQKP